MYWKPNQQKFWIQSKHSDICWQTITHLKVFCFLHSTLPTHRWQQAMTSWEPCLQSLRQSLIELKLSFNFKTTNVYKHSIGCHNDTTCALNWLAFWHKAPNVNPNLHHGHYPLGIIIPTVLIILNSWSLVFIVSW